MRDVLDRAANAADLGLREAALPVPDVCSAMRGDCVRTRDLAGVASARMLGHMPLYTRRKLETKSLVERCELAERRARKILMSDEGPVGMRVPEGEGGGVDESPEKCAVR